MSTLVLQVLLSVLGIAGTLFTLWMKSDAEKKKEKSDAKQKIEDDVSSGDVSRINNSVQRLRSKKTTDS